MLREILGRCGDGRVTLLFSAKDEVRNQAVVLKAVLDDTIRQSTPDRAQSR